MPLNLFIPLIFFSRLVSLFSFAPLVFAIIETYPSHTSTSSLSLLCSIYPVTQAIFQYPWARLSDSISRLILIRVILLVFIASSLGCFFSSSIEQLIFFRGIQGACALQAVVQAYLSDYLTPKELKRSMLFIGLSVTFALFIGYSSPLLVSFFEFSPQVIFLMSALLSSFALFSSFHLNLPVSTISNVLQPQSIRFTDLNLYPFVINFIIHFTHSFLLISASSSLGSDTSKNYLLLLFIALIFSAPALSPSRSSNFILNYCATLVFFSIVSFYPLLLETFIYFSLFTNFSLLLILEASIPSLLVSMNSKYPKGQLMGMNAFIQYISMSLGFYLAPLASKTNFCWIILIFSYCFLLSSLILLNLKSNASQDSALKDY